MMKNNMKNKEYKIEKLTDMLAVPEESIDNMLLDLKGWILMRHATESINEVTGQCLVCTTDYMRWIDDGKNDVTASITFRS